MRTTATQFGILFGVVTGLGQILAGNPVSAALFFGLVTGCSVLLALFAGDLIVDRLFGSLDKRSAPIYESVTTTEERDRDESASDSALAA